jgi:5-methylcytosine-specific restriction protein A
MSRLPRPCLNCGALIPSGSRCQQCQAAWEAKRGTSTQRGYDSAWRRLSARVIAEEGRCRDCGTTGTPDNPLTADHIIAKVRGGTNERSNLTCRCRRHNSSKGGR